MTNENGAFERSYFYGEFGNFMANYGSVSEGNMIGNLKTLVQRIAIVLIFLITIAIVYIIVGSRCTSQSYQSVSYYTKNYCLKSMLSKNFANDHDTTEILEVWAKNKYQFAESYYLPGKFQRKLKVIRNQTDTLYIFFVECDTVYAIHDTTISVSPIPSIPYNMSRQILEDSLVKLPSILTVENMELRRYKEEKGKTILSSETFIWINPTAHLAAYAYIIVDSVSRKELWSWQAWNVRIPDSVFIIPRGLTVISKNKAFYDTLFPPGPGIIYKRFVIPPVSSWWFLFKYHLKRLFN